MKNNKLIFVLAVLSLIFALFSCAPFGEVSSGSQPLSKQPPGLSNPPGPGNQTGLGGQKKSNNQKGIVGIFSWERVSDNQYYVIRYLKNNNNISRNDFIDLLNNTTIDGQNFRVLFNSSIADLPAPGVGKNGYQLQLPVIRASVVNEAVYVLAISDNVVGGLLANNLYNNYLFHCTVSPVGAIQDASYNNRFWRIFGVNNANPLLFSVLNINPLPPTTLGEGAVVFQGGAAPDPEQIMVSPCPATTTANHDDDLFVHHIYSFAKKVAEPAETRRLHALWYAVGQAARQMFDGVNPVKKLTVGAATHNSLFISTHGVGIRYLHVRVEDDPRYYHQKIELKTDLASKNYFLTLFPN